MPDTPYRLAVVHTHVVEYLGPLYRRLAARPELDLTVYYESLRGAEAGYDRDFGITVRWDRPLLDGYRYEVVEPWWALASRIRAGRFDAVWVSGWTTRLYWLAYVACLAAGIPYLVGGDSIARPDRGLARQLLGRVVLRPLFARAAAFLTMGALNEARYREHGADPSRFFLVPYSPDVAYLRHEAGRARSWRDELRRRHGVRTDRPVILFVGKLIARKQPLDLARAFAALREDGVVASLVYCGDGPLRPAIEAYVRDRALPDVHILGFVNQSRLPQVYAMSDVLALPSDRDNWGVVLNEAMACGLPVIVSDRVGAAGEPRFIRHEDNGLIYPARDVAALAAKLRALVTSPARARRLAQNAQRTVQWWNYDLCVEGILGALRAVRRPRTPVAEGTP